MKEVAKLLNDMVVNGVITNYAVFGAIAQMRYTEAMEGTPFRVVRADYLAAIALSVGRAKDSARVLALLESGAISAETIENFCASHCLVEQWARFKRRFLDA